MASNKKLVEFIDTVAAPYNRDECLIWPFGRSANGYAQVTYDGQRVGVHRLMCQLENGKPDRPNLHAAHLCGNGKIGCINRNHLRWKTAKENSADRLVHGTVPRGETQGSARLTEPEVKQIRSLKGQKTQREIGLQFGVTKQHVKMIQARKAWSWLEA